MSEKLLGTSICLFCGESAKSTLSTLKGESSVETFKWKRSWTQVLSETLCTPNNALVVKDILGRAAFCERCDLQLKDLGWAIQSVKTLGSRIADNLKGLFDRIFLHNKEIKYESSLARATGNQQCVQEAIVDVLDSIDEPFWSNTSNKDIQSTLFRKLADNLNVKTDVWDAFYKSKLVGSAIPMMTVVRAPKTADPIESRSKQPNSGKESVRRNKGDKVTKIHGKTLQTKKEKIDRNKTQNKTRQNKLTSTQQRISWKCSIKGCRVRCLSEVGLKDHFYRVHLGIKKPSSCHLCDKRFPNAYRLNIHKRAPHKPI